MKTFKDASQREWQLSLTLGTAMAVKARCGIDLLQPEAGDPPTITRLGTDEMLLAEVLLVMLESQFEAQRVTDADVRNAFDGRTLLDAQQAFYEELQDFFRQCGRKDREVAVAKQKQVLDAAIAALTARMESIDVATLTRGVMSGASPAASALTLGP